MKQYRQDNAETIKAHQNTKQSTSYAIQKTQSLHSQRNRAEVSILHGNT